MQFGGEMDGTPPALVPLLPCLITLGDYDNIYGVRKLTHKKAEYPPVRYQVRHCLKREGTGTQSRLGMGMDHLPSSPILVAGALMPPMRASGAPFAQGRAASPWLRHGAARAAAIGTRARAHACAGWRGRRR